MLGRVFTGGLAASLLAIAAHAQDGTLESACPSPSAVEQCTPSGRNWKNRMRHA